MKHRHIGVYLICGDIKLWYVWGKKHILSAKEKDG